MAKRNESAFYADPATLEVGKEYLVMPEAGRYVRVLVLGLPPKGRYAEIRLLNGGHEQIWRKDRFVAPKDETRCDIN